MSRSRSGMGLNVLTALTTALQPNASGDKSGGRAASGDSAMMITVIALVAAILMSGWPYWSHR